MARTSTTFETGNSRSDLAACRIDTSADRDRFFERIHAELAVDATAYAIVNDGRRLLECDRLAVLESRPGGSRLLAVSGVDHVDRRGASGQTLEQLAHAVAATKEPLFYSGDSSSLSPQLHQPLEEYVNQSHVRRLAVVPLLTPSGEPEGGASTQVLGVFVAEDFQLTSDDEQLWAGVADIRPQVTLALRNALAYQRLPLASLSRLLLRAARVVRRPRSVLLLAALTGFAGVILFCQIEFLVRAGGRLQPTLRRDVFAPADAVVRSVLVAHGATVEAGEPLVELGSPELELELSRLSGELLTARQRLQTARVRLWDSSATEDAAAREGQWAAQEQQLVQQIRGLEAQRELLVEQQTRLIVMAPIAGRVLTWNTTQLLADRPVRRGQKLLTVADPNSEWMAELSVRDRDIGQLLSAQEQLGSELPVTFLLATDSRSSGQGRIQRVAIASEPGPSGDSGMQVSVEIDRETLRAPRSGAEVLAKIHCGRRTIAYVWFHQLISTVRRHVFF